MKVWLPYQLCLFRTESNRSRDEDAARIEDELVAASQSKLQQVNHTMDLIIQQLLGSFFEGPAGLFFLRDG